MIINCYTSEALLEAEAPRLQQILVEMGENTHQGAVGLVIDREYLERQFPLEEANDG